MKGDESIFPDPMRGADVSADNQNPHDLPKGLTKREYFAAMALQGWIASFAGLGESPKIDTAAKKSTEFADALLAELEK